MNINNPELVAEILYSLNTYHAYDFLRRSIIEKHEGKRNKVYIDTSGNKTIGIGFNMDSCSAGQTWLKAFGSMDSFYSDNVILTDEQIYKLLDICIENAYNIAAAYYPFIGNLSLNQRLVLEDLCFNNPALCKKGTKFHEYMTCYYNSQDINMLYKACEELRLRSNKAKLSGIQKRREYQSSLLLYPYENTIKSVIANCSIPNGHIS